MKRAWMILAVLCLLPFTGCAGCRNDWKHLQSDFVGLKRRVTMYAADGSVIKEWEIQAKVEDNGGTCYFIDDDGHAVTVAGDFIIQEID